MGSAAAGVTCALVRPPPRVPTSRRRKIAHAGARHGHALTRGYAYCVGPRITHIDRAIIRAYFREVDGAAAPSRREIQPELTAPQLQTTRLPAELEQKLSVLSPEYRRVLTGREVLLIEGASGSVIDVLQDIHTSV